MKLETICVKLNVEHRTDEGSLSSFKHGSWESWSEYMTVTSRGRDLGMQTEGGMWILENKYQAVISSYSLQHGGGYCSLR